MCLGWAKAHEQNIRSVGSLLEVVLGFVDVLVGVYSNILSDSSMKPRFLSGSFGEGLVIVVSDMFAC